MRIEVKHAKQQMAGGDMRGRANLVFLCDKDRMMAFSWDAWREVSDVCVGPLVSEVSVEKRRVTLLVYMRCGRCGRCAG